ncbi:MAG TPA: hypothetical protein VMS98_15765 [Thermoanaerobaculia bacterium]|nr:hypothetical protein [Thermoanaerobaculia bacterium]
MAKHDQEFRDPIHNFVRATADEVKAINAMDQQLRRDAVQTIARQLTDRFGRENVQHRVIPPKQQHIDFPVLLDSREISTSIAESQIYADFKPATVGFVFISPERRKDAETWLKDNKKRILSEQMELDL